MPPSSTVTSFSRETHAPGDHAPDGRRAGEEDLVDAATRASATPTSAPPCDDPHETLRQAGAREHARDPLAGEARARGRLEDDAVAGQQRARDLAERLRERRAAGADHADHAVGLVGDARALGERHASG